MDEANVLAQAANPRHHRKIYRRQKFQSPQEIVEFFGEVEGDIAQEVEAVAEEGLERSLKRFFEGIGRSRL